MSGTGTGYQPLVWDDLTRRPRPEPDATIAYGSDLLQRSMSGYPEAPGRIGPC
ncbi:hypothetical protein P0F65_22270 [Sphingomonas sp. I4]